MYKSAAKFHEYHSYQNLAYRCTDMIPSDKIPQFPVIGKSAAVGSYFFQVKFLAEFHFTDPPAVGRYHAFGRKSLVDFSILSSGYFKNRNYEKRNLGWFLIYSHEFRPRKFAIEESKIWKDFECSKNNFASH